MSNDQYAIGVTEDGAVVLQTPDNHDLFIGTVDTINRCCVRAAARLIIGASMHDHAIELVKDLMANGRTSGNMESANRLMAKLTEAERDAEESVELTDEVKTMFFFIKSISNQGHDDE